MEHLGEVRHVECRFGSSEIVLVQGRCMVYAKRTIGSEIGLDAPDGTLR